MAATANNTKSSMTHSFSSYCFKEFLIAKRMLETNASAFLLFFILPLVGRYLTMPTSTGDLVRSIISSSFTYLIMSYTFEAAKRIFLAKEDELNKPSRLISCGLLTERSLRYRLVLSFLCGPLVLGKFYGFEVFLLTIIWEFEIFIYYIWPKSNNGLIRSIFVGFFTLTAMRVSNIVLKDINGHWNLPLVYDLIVCFWIIMAISFQDYSETKGDRATGKETLSITIRSEISKKFRSFLSTVVILNSLIFFIIACFYFFYDRAILILLVSFYHVVLAMILGGRINQDKNVRVNQKSYCRNLSYTLFMIYIQVTYFGLKSSKLFW